MYTRYSKKSTAGTFYYLGIQDTPRRVQQVQFITYVHKILQVVYSRYSLLPRYTRYSNKSKAGTVIDPKYNEGALGLAPLDPTSRVQHSPLQCISVLHGITIQ